MLLGNTLHSIAQLVCVQLWWQALCLDSLTLTVDVSSYCHLTGAKSVAKESKSARVYQGSAARTHCSRIDGGKLFGQLIKSNQAI